MGIIEIVIIFTLTVTAAVTADQVVKKIDGPPPFQSPSDAPVFKGDIKITPEKKMNI